VQSVTLRLYSHGRHEMLNETNRDEVHADLVAWLDALLAKQGADAEGARDAPRARRS
jgi:alpha-beta hydrolase superfamily lysophospholipase